MPTTYSNVWNSVSVLWERPLGTVELTGGYLWLSGSPDSMDLGVKTLHRNVYGNRYAKETQLKVVSSDPNGALGKTPLWFKRDGIHSRLNRILNTHFQNFHAASPIPPAPCYTAHYPTDDVPTTVSGFTIIRDMGFGLGTANVWSSCVANELEVSWKVGEPVMVKPTFLCLNGQPHTTVVGAVVSDDVDYQEVYAQAPDITCSWNGTTFQPASFNIKSTNNINIKHSHESKIPVGMTFGKFNAELTLDVWVDENYNSWFIPNYLGASSPMGVTGTFHVRMTGIDLGGKTYNIYINYIGKLVNMASSKPSKTGLQTIKATLYDLETSVGDYTDAGYWIKVDGVNVAWQ